MNFYSHNNYNNNLYYYNYKDKKSDFLSLFDNTTLDDIDLLDYSETLALEPISSTMNDETRKNLRRIQDRTLQLEKERRGALFISIY